MCNQKTYNLLVDVVNKKMRNKEIFSAYDVFLEYERRDINPETYSSVKNDIRSILSSHVEMMVGSYKRNLVTMPNGKQANVFYPTGQNPQTHSPSIKKTQTQTQVQASQRTKTVKNSTKQTQTDKSGRLLVPAKFVSQAGADQTGSLFVFKGDNAKNTVIARSKAPSSGREYVSYAVDQYNNVKISKSTLNKFGLNPSKPVNIDFNNGSIVLRQS